MNKILIISQNFKPMNNGGAIRVSDLYDHLTLNNDVKVIAEPNTLTFKMKSKSSINRLLNYFSFGITSCIKTLLSRYNDVCIISSPSPIPIITNTILKGIKFNKLIFDIRDVWFISVIAYGQMKQSFITKMYDYIWYDLCIIGNISSSMYSILKQTKHDNHEQINIKDVDAWIKVIREFKYKKTDTYYNPITLNYRGEQYDQVIKNLLI